MAPVTTLNGIRHTRNMKPEELGTSHNFSEPQGMKVKKYSLGTRLHSPP